MTAAKGITVNCVVPGAIKTDMVSALPEDIVQAVIDTIPMHALGTPTTWRRPSATWCRTRRTTLPARSSRWPGGC